MIRVYEQVWSHEQSQIIYGGMLGDSFISNPYKYGNKHSIYSMEHSEKQSQYLLFKAEVLGMTHYTRDRYDIRTDKTYHSVVAYSQASPTFNNMYDKVYKDGHKTLDVDMLNNLGLLGLCIWYCDDGCTDYNGRRCRLCTEKYTLREQQVLQQWFIDKWNIHPIIAEKQSNGKILYILTFDVVESYRLLELMRPFCPTPDVAYKFVTKPYTSNREPAWHRELREAHNV